MAAVLHPFPIPKHQDVGSRHTAAFRAGGKIVHQKALSDVDLRQELFGGPNSCCTGFKTLQVMDRPVTFCDAIRGETRLLKMPIYVRCEYRCPVWKQLAPFAQDFKSIVRLRFAIELKPVTIEAPSQARLRAKSLRRSNGKEVGARAAQRRISAPEAFVTAEIGQA